MHWSEHSARTNSEARDDSASVENTNVALGEGFHEDAGGVHEHDDTLSGDATDMVTDEDCQQSTCCGAEIDEADEVANGTSGACCREMKGFEEGRQLEDGSCTSFVPSVMERCNELRLNMALSIATLRHLKTYPLGEAESAMIQVEKKRFSEKTAEGIVFMCWTCLCRAVLRTQPRPLRSERVMTCAGG